MLPKFLPLKVCAHAYDSSLKTAKSSMSEDHISHPLEPLHGICINCRKVPLCADVGKMATCVKKVQKASHTMNS
jgi:hypothetical protein